MKYQDIKTADTVYLQVLVSTGWHSEENFWLPKKVEKVTPKQFQVDGDKYRKKDGSRVTSDYRMSGECKNLGDKIYWNDTVVIDQTKE